MMKRAIPFISISLFCTCSALANMDEGTGMRNRFLEGYQMGYQHGLQDGYIKGHLTAPESIQEHKKAMEGHGTDFHHGGMESYAPQESFRRFSEKLKLTPQQQEKVRPILNAEVSEIQEIHADKTLSREQKQKMIQATIEKTHMEVNQSLTPEQQQIFKQMAEERKAMYRKMGEERK